jgi:hypothetical protein
MKNLKSSKSTMRACDCIHRDHAGRVMICQLDRGHAGDHDGPRPTITLKNARAIKAFHARELAAFRSASK